jgi:hypothetical protein
MAEPYLIAVHLLHSAALIGADTGAPTMNRTTASSTEQKLFAPDPLVAGVATAT